MAKKNPPAAKPQTLKRTPPPPPKGGPPTDETPPQAGLESVERSQTDPMEEATEPEDNSMEEEDEDSTQYMPRNLDLDSMDKATLMQVAMRYFGRRLDDSQSESVMREQLRQLMGGRQNRYSQAGL